MIVAGCRKIKTNIETVAIRNIINGLECNEAFDSFRTSWRMIPAKVRPETIDELERLMVEHASESKVGANWQSDGPARWQFLGKIQSVNPARMDGEMATVIKNRTEYNAKPIPETRRGQMGTKKWQKSPETNGKWNVCTSTVTKETGPDQGINCSSDAGR